uniref:C-type lectin domain-containing protein n=1 Tax=Branchiostoma floridae TaxID=7739 RepID=C3ZR50_BRAFL|eukprot:XP_002588912.1 hypothetical protein BRAFLDRAFT_89100 [Branchiostoma floridae]
MYEQAEPVRSPFPRPDRGQTSGPPPEPPPVHQGGSRGRVRHGNGTDKPQEEQDASSHTYEEAEAVKRYATHTSADRTYPGRASGGRGLCSFIRSRLSYMAAGIVVLLSLVAVGFAPLTVMNKEEITQLSTTVDALKRDRDDMRQLSTAVDALKCDQDDIRQLSTTVDALKRDRDDMRQLSATVDALKRGLDDMSTTVDALKRDQDDIRQLSTTVDALKRNKDDIRQLSTTVDALKRNQDDMRQPSTTVDALKRDRDDMRHLSATVDALKRDQDDMSTTVDALKRDQDDMSTTVDALKRNQDDMRQLSTTVDALKRDQDDMRHLSATVDALKRDQDDMSTTVDALKRDQDDTSTTVDALKRDQDDMSTTVDALKRDQDDMSTTVDVLKRDLDSERSRVTALEQRRQEKLSCPEGYAVFHGICYKAFDTFKTFSGAAAACGEDGGTLAMPRDAETNAFLISLYKSVRDRHFWIGLHDRREEGSFEWVDGSALGTYSNWGPGEPNNYMDNQDCVLYAASPKEKWHQYPCDWLLRFICQAVPGMLINDVRRRQAELSPPLYSGSPTIRSKTDQQNVKPGMIVSGTTPMQQTDWQACADAAASDPNPMHASGEDTTPMQQPQTDWRSIADAAASIPNALYVSRADREYTEGARRRALCSFICSHRSCIAAGIAVLIAVGLAPLMFINKEGVSELFTALKRDQDVIRQLFTTVDALKRDRDDMSATVDALKRDQDDMRQLSTTVDALKRDQDDVSTTVDALKSDKDDMSNTVDALKRDLDDMSTTVDALKRDQDDMSTAVDALKRDQDDMSATVDALKRNLTGERSRVTTLEQRLREIR